MAKRFVVCDAACWVVYYCLIWTHGLGLSDLDWHILSVDDLLARLSISHPQGFSIEQVRQQIAEYGNNTPTPLSPGGFGQLWAISLVVLALYFSVVPFLSLLPGSPRTAPSCGELGTCPSSARCVSNTGSFQCLAELVFIKVMASIATMLLDDCLFIRDNTQKLTTAVDLGPGDCINIKQGNKLPADVQFVEVSTDAKFDRSILIGMIFCIGLCWLQLAVNSWITGESVPISGNVNFHW